MTRCYSDHNEDIRTKGSCDLCGGTERDADERATHTPGPWTWSIGNITGGHALHGPTDDSVVLWVDDQAPSDADARLIAAAPSMYTAACSLVDAWDDPDADSKRLEEAVESVRQAMVAARGES